MTRWARGCLRAVDAALAKPKWGSDASQTGQDRVAAIAVLKAVRRRLPGKDELSNSEEIAVRYVVGNCLRELKELKL